MADTDQGGAGALLVDDTMDDARAAFEEVTKAAESAAAEPEQQAEPAKVEAEKPAAEAEEKPADARARDPETGKFTAKEKLADKPQEQSTLDKIKQQDGQKPEEQKPLDQAKPEEQASAAPPPSWSIGAKSAWAKLPPEVQQAVAKREAEVNAGFAELRDYKDLKPFRERAARAGQSLGQALAAYTGIEELFSRNPVQGFLHVADNLGQRGISPMQLGEIFSTLARQYGGTAPNFTPADQNGQGGANGYQTPGQDPNPLLSIVQPIVQRLSSLEGMLNQRTETDRANSARSVEGVVQRFRTDPQYKYFSNVEDQIAQLIESGIVQKTGDHTADLAKAYELACWHNPEIRDQLINEQNAQKSEAQKQAEKAIADKAKAASKSLNGSAAPGTVIQEKANGADDIEADVRKAVRQHAA